MRSTLRRAAHSPPRALRRSKDSAISNWIYITAIFLSAILFAAGHLPATAQLLGLSTPILIRAFVLNGIAGLGFGYFMQNIFMPILY